MGASSRVIIVGGGWAGLAAALELSRHQIPFTLLESAPQLGGRARTVCLDGAELDNGQHLLIGAYHEILRLLAEMGIDESAVLSREQLQLLVQERGDVLRLTAPPLPAPLHLLWGLLAAQGISRRDKWQALRMSLSLASRGYRLAEDCSVATLLAQHRQGTVLIRRFWEPLCIATLNTPLEKASAQVFLRVLQDSFTRHHSDADLLIPRVPLGELFPEAAASYLKQRHDDDVIRLRQRVTALRLGPQGMAGLSGDFGDIDTADLILAVSPVAAGRLLRPHAPLQGLASQIGKLGTQPVITAYLQFPADFRLPQTMIGLSGRLGQWLFDRRVCGQPGLVALVISAEGEHCRWDNARLLAIVQQELREEFPGWPAVETARVIREKRATFECHVGVESLRPGNATAVPGLWLAGDYTATGYPATLEGAVISGVQCARRLAAQRQSSN